MSLRVALRLGAYQSVLHGVTCDAVISDPPYTKRTMLGFRSGSDFRAEGRVVRAGGTRAPRGKDRRPVIPYAALTEAEAVDLARWATARARHWIVLFNDHEGWRWLSAAIRAQGWYVFCPSIWHAGNSPPRFQGDGPNNPFEYIVVARPERVVKCGALKAFYDLPRLASTTRESLGLTGQKPLELMRRIIGQYSQPGQVVCDPFAGTGTTLVAARELGRHAIGAERDPATHALAQERLARPIAAPKEAV